MRGVVTSFNNPLVAPSMKTIPHDSSYDLMLRSQHTTPRSVSRCSPPSNWPCASLRRLGPFRLLLSLQRSVIDVDFHVWLCLIRICPNRPSFSSTCFLYGLSGHNSNSPSWPSLASFRCVALTPPTRGGFGTIIGMSIVPPILFLLSTTIACQSTTFSATTGPIYLHVQHLPIRVHAP